MVGPVVIWFRPGSNAGPTSPLCGFSRLNPSTPCYYPYSTYQLLGSMFNIQHYNSKPYNLFKVLDKRTILLNRTRIDYFQSNQSDTTSLPISARFHQATRARYLT